MTPLVFWGGGRKGVFAIVGLSREVRNKRQILRMTGFLEFIQLYTVVTDL
jgi:hypothetical protein